MTASNTSPMATRPLYDSSPRNYQRADYQNRDTTPDVAAAPLEARTSRSERALDWFQRCQHQRAQERRSIDLPPENPAAAAWAFFRGTSIHGGTGIGFVDECIARRQRQRHNNNNKLPAIELRGEGGTGKTSTLVSLAARFVAATRPSLFSPTTGSTADGGMRSCTPRVIVLDSTLDMTSLQIANSVTSFLLLVRQQQDPTTTNMTMLEQDIESCLSRIHVSHVEDAADWIPVLESIRCQLLYCHNHHHLSKDRMDTATDAAPAAHAEDETDFPILLLWDGFLSESGLAEGSKKEITRQLALLLKDCKIGFVCTTTNYFNSAGKGPLASTVVQLERNDNTDTRHDFMATILPGNYRIPYSLSSAGVLR